MEHAVHVFAEYVSLSVNLLAIVVIAIGSIQGAIGLTIGFLTRAPEAQLRPVWLALGRWLVAGLTFQLAADIVDTVLAPTWEDIGRLAAIAAIRTFLNYFLAKDMAELRERGLHEAQSSAS